MEKSKHTPWYPGSVNPARTGVYKVVFWRRVVYANWNGSYWGTGYYTPHECLFSRASATCRPIRWRGLKEKA